MLYEGKYSLKKNLLIEMDRMEFYQNLQKDQLEFKQKQVETWEDLKALIVMHLEYESMQKKAAAAGEFAGKTIKNIFSLVPGLGTFMAAGGLAKDGIELGKTLWDLSKEDTPVQNNTLFGLLQIDPEYADIIEYGLQDDIIRDFMKAIGEKSGKISGSEEWQNMNEYVEWWLENNYGDGPETVTGADDSTSFTDLKVPDLPPDLLTPLVTFGTELF